MAADIYRLIIHTKIGGVRPMNSLHFQLDAGVADDPHQVCGELINSWLVVFGPRFRAMLADNVRITHVSGRRINNNGGPTYNTSSLTLMGTRPSSCRMPQLGPFLVAYFPSGFGWALGQLWIPGVAEGDVVDQLRFTDVLRAIVQEFGDGLKNDAANTTMGPAHYVIWSKAHFGATYRPLGTMPGPGLINVDSRLVGRSDQF